MKGAIRKCLALYMYSSTYILGNTWISAAQSCSAFTCCTYEVRLTLASVLAGNLDIVAKRAEWASHLAVTSARALRFAWYLSCPFALFLEALLHIAIHPFRRISTASPAPRKGASPLSRVDLSIGERKKHPRHPIIAQRARAWGLTLT